MIANKLNVHIPLSRGSSFFVAEYTKTKFLRIVLTFCCNSARLFEIVAYQLLSIFNSYGFSWCVTFYLAIGYFLWLSMIKVKLQWENNSFFTTLVLDLYWFHFLISLDLHDPGFALICPEFLLHKLLRHLFTLTIIEDELNLSNSIDWLMLPSFNLCQSEFDTLIALIRHDTEIFRCFWPSVRRNFNISTKNFLRF